MDVLLIAGIIIVLGFIGGKVSNGLKFPGVIGYIIAGVIIGPSLLGIFDHAFLEKAGIINDFALGLIAFLIGSELRWEIIKKAGKSIVVVTFVQAVMTFILLGVGVFIYTRSLALGLIFGALGVATAPAGTYVVLRECRAKGSLTNTLLAVVGLDDAMAIVIFSFAVALAKVSIGGAPCESLWAICWKPLYEIAGSIIIGIILGLIVVFTSRKRHDRNEILTIAIASIFVCSGLSNMLHMSLILSNLVLGIVIINISSLTGKRISDSIQNIISPVFLFFFVMAGAHMRISLLPAMGMLGLIYIFIRIIGKIGGAYIGAVLGKMEDKIRKNLGYGLLSQAGVAIGLAILIGREFGIHSDIASKVITVIAATTIVFEIIGALGVKYSIKKAEEIGQAEH